jgi:uncharacterized membrane protein YcaP (DUF421 family)
MFELTNPWFEFPLRALLMYAALLVMVRLSGKRTVGQFTPFDLLVVMLLSESVSAGLTGGDDSVTAGLLAAATLIVINIAVAFVAARSRRTQVALEGQAVLIGRDGTIFEGVIRRHHVPRSDVEQSLRESDCEEGKFRFAFLEADGRISILKESENPAGEWRD